MLNQGEYVSSYAEHLWQKRTRHMRRERAIHGAVAVTYRVASRGCKRISIMYIQSRAGASCAAHFTDSFSNAFRTKLHSG